MNHIIQDTQEIFQLLEGEKILLFIIIAAMVAALVLLVLLLRKAWLWFGKTNQWLSVLAKIEERMWALEIQTHSRKEQPDAAAQLQKSQESCSDLEEHVQRDLPTARGKSGKVYTEAELELLIRE